MLVKLCGMLGSDFEGERAAAALKIAGLLRETGLRWDDILTLPSTTTHHDPVASGSSKPTWSDRASGPMFVDWRADLACCTRHRARLTKAELDHVDGLRIVLRTGRSTIRSSDIPKLAAAARRIRKQLSERSSKGATHAEARA
ncbi:MAG: hypothetical protein NVSMB18_11530 [Acetobacteraceae bacterium]